MRSQFVRSFPKLTAAQYAALEGLAERCPTVKVIGWREGGPFVQYPNGFRRVVFPGGKIG